jgi:hypothetical protein
MNKLLLTLFVFTVLISCKDNPVSKKINETKESVSNTNNAVKEINKMQSDIEELQEIKPLSNDELKAWLPENVNGMKRISYKAGQMGVVQISSVEATYASDDKSKSVKVEVIDGAGQMGAAATAGMRMLFSQDFEEEDEYKTRKTVNKKGFKAIEEYRKDRNNTTIELMEDKRFYIKITGTNMDINETWDVISELEPKNLG